ncbi:MAG: sensor histidine kinase [Hylemonella sp.]|nr:sensor histidine kinase [Hylemonella sp.]MDP1936630.1 sensor histidine kinase [Hylemonella sp.]
MKAAWSRFLRWRLLGATLVAVSVALLGAGFLLSSLFRTHVTAQFEAQLLRQLDQLTAALEPDAQQRPQLTSSLSDPRWQTPYSGLYWQIEAQGAADAAATPERPVLRSRSLWDTELPLPRDTLGQADVHRHLIPGPNGQVLLALERSVQFIASAPSASSAAAQATPGWRLVVAGDVAELESAVASFSRQLGLSLAVLGAALLAAAWAQVTLGLLPLRKLQAAVQSIRQGREQRLEGAFPAEVDPLVQDFNQVLDQNEQVVKRARQMAGNLAHAIKTPLAVISNLAEDPGSAPRAWASQLQEQVATIRHQVDWHLGRARASSAGVAGLRTEVEPVLQGLVRVMRKVHAQREGRPGLTINVLPMAAGLQFAGESQDLQEMAGNLLDNACKWAHSRVQLVASQAQGQLHITIEDDGPGLSETERGRVFERGVRADERTPGTGLGLDIARELAGLYQGEVRLDASRLGGLKAELMLPGFSKRDALLN